MNPLDAVVDLLRQCAAAPHGAGRIALAEEAVRHADVLGDLPLSFEARLAATEAYNNGGEPDKAITTFLWCLAEADRDPAAYVEWDDTLRIWFIYIVNVLVNFPAVPMDRLELVLDEMERRYRIGGHGLHEVYGARTEVAAYSGHLAEASRWYARWRTAPRDPRANCDICEVAKKTWYLAYRGDDEAAVRMAQPFLTAGLTCPFQPAGVLSVLLLPYARTGRLDEARRAHRSAYRVHRSTGAPTGAVAHHLVFLALTGNEAAGLEILQRHLHWLDRAPSPGDAMEFAAAAALLARRLVEIGYADLTVYRRAYGDRADGEVTMTELHAELATTACAIAAEFDARHANGHQSDWVRARIEAAPIVACLPLAGCPAGLTAGEAGSAGS